MGGLPTRRGSGPSGGRAIRSTADLGTRWSTLPWWAQVLVVAGLARVLSGVGIALVASTQDANVWLPAAPGYLKDAGLMWDGSWYREIAEHGYPHTLPTGPDGRVLQNAWAFFPLFPMAVRGLMVATGGPWHVVAPVLALLLGLAAMLVVHAAVADALHRTDLPEPVRRHGPLASVALLATSASAPVLQVAYTEALALLLVAGTLWAVQRHSYALAGATTVALGFTRAVALPVLLVVVVHGLARLRSRRTFPVRDRVAVLALAALAAGSGFAWPVVAARVTGVADAYRLTQGAWRGRGEVLVLVPWLDVSVWLVGTWAPLLLGAVAALLVMGLAAPPVRALGPVLHAWLVGYAGYLVVVLEPGTSLVRFALLGFPAWAALALAALTSRRPRLFLVLAIMGGLVGQAAWLGLLWRMVPPAGWPP